MKHKLTFEEIEEFSSLPGIRKFAVENFLMTIQNNSNRLVAEDNLNYDAKCYSWNKETVEAIKKGIDFYFDKFGKVEEVLPFN